MGANLGYMTALLARRVGSSGRVFSFEALPENVEKFQANVGRWRGVVDGGSIRVIAQFFNPVLLEASKPVARSSWVPQSFVATLDPERALRGTQPSGWQSLM